MGQKTSSIFYLVGIPSLQDVLFLPVFFTFLSFYLLILVGNALILVAVVIEPRLHKPMYFFLINLSALDILFTTSTVPKMLSLLLLGDHYLSFSACFLQMYLFHSFSCSEAFILVVMAYDCYVAICRPLQYPVLMTPQTNAALAASAWLTALLLPIPAVVQTSHMAFDSTVYIYNCFCDHLAVVQASCSDTTPPDLHGILHRHGGVLPAPSPGASLLCPHPGLSASHQLPRRTLQSLLHLQLPPPGGWHLLLIHCHSLCGLQG